MVKDYTRHIQFMESIVHRHEWTEAERRYLFQAQPVSYYGTEVALIGRVTPEQFFEEHPDWTAKIEKAMEAVLQERAEEKEIADERTLLIKRIEELEAKLKKTEAKPAEKTPAETPAEEPETTEA